jgi:hypothetical protein
VYRYHSQALEVPVNLALRPYVTTGVAIVGASVIAVAPIVPTPTEIQIPNPVAQLERPVQLAANEIEDAVNALAFAGAEVLVSLAKLPAPVVAQLLGVPEPVAQLLLAGSALGLSGPLIGGLGAGGAAIQDVVDQLGSGDIAALINALIGAPATLIDGVVNGGFGPNVGPLLGLPAILPVLVGGLINPGGLGLDGLTLPGAIPTLQALLTTLLSAFGGADMLSTLAVTPASEGQIEGAVNFLLFNLVASPIVTVAGLLGSVLAPLVGEEQATLLPLAALGLLGPLISGPGAVGSALQDVVDSLGSGDLAGVLSALIGAPATIIDGVVNGGYGPSLTPLVGPLLFPGIPVGVLPTFLAGGLINGPDLVPPIVLPGTIPTVQKLVGQILGLVTSGPAGIPGLSTLQGLVGQILGLVPSGPLGLPAGTPSTLASVNSVDTSNKRLVTLDVTPDVGDDTSGKDAAPDVTPAGPTADLTANLPSAAKVPPKVDEIQAAIDITTPGPDLGKTVSGLAKPDTLDTTDGAKFIPETTASDDGGNGKKGGGGSNPVGSAISSVANSFAGAVRGALGG